MNSPSFPDPYVSQLVIRDDFSDWLAAECADVTDMEAVSGDIREGLFPLLHYNQFRLSEPSCDIRFNVPRQELIFGGGFDVRNLSTNSGQCAELTGKLLLLVATKYPELAADLVFVQGHDPSYFYRAGSKHYFAILDKEMDDDALALDPALGYCGPLKEGGYSVVRPLCSASELGRYDHSFSLMPIPDFTPFSRSEDERLIHFGWVSKASREDPLDRIRIGVHPKMGALEWFSPDDETLGLSPDILAEFSRLRTRIELLDF
jgi:hypothetical protein